LGCRFTLAVVGRVMVGGSVVGRFALQAMDKEELQDVLDYCDQEGFVTDMTRKCTDMLNQIIDADEVSE
jgi:hypothetical protein